MNYYIGCSGYFYWGWKGKFYPEDLKPNQWFKYYSENFNTVEINSTFYHFPKKHSLKKWYREAPENFKFTLKVHKSITHLKRFRDVKDELNKFYETTSLLENKLGCLLFQMPPSFKYSKENIELIIENLNKDFKNVVEFRHVSWWNKEVYEVFKENKIIFCSVSAPKLPDDIIKTSNDIYIRFHGKNKWYRYNYSNQELKTYAEKIKSLKCENLYCYFNNDFNAYAPFNALKFKEILL